MTLSMILIIAIVLCLLSWTPQGRNVLPAMNLQYLLSVILMVVVIFWLIRYMGVSI